jgi:hypothetical protein
MNKLKFSNYNAFGVPNQVKLTINSKEITLYRINYTAQYETWYTINGENYA